MKILSGRQIREADAYTIAHEPVASEALMERAATAFASKFREQYPAPGEIFVFCGPGNNGGDGLAIARLLQPEGYHPRIILLDFGGDASKDFKINLERLEQRASIPVLKINNAIQLPDIKHDAVVIDAIFGTGLSRPAEGLAAAAIERINNSGATIVSVDMPSGLFTDTANEKGQSIVRASRTFTFQLPKLSFFFCSNAMYTGNWEILDIGLDPEFIDNAECADYYIDAAHVKSILRPRQHCDHKGSFGHALIWAGGYGKIGAALMCTDACMHAGAGLTTVYIPECGYEILQTGVPEAMVLTDPDEKKLSGLPPDIEKYNALGIGPGIGMHLKTAQALGALLKEVKDIPVVIDADALNIIAAHPDAFGKLPRNCILTPHPKEFERIAGPAANDWERHNLASDFAKTHHCVLVLKGAYTSIHLPDGRTWFNATGNPGMAKGGSGDVLTGIITALLAQKYSTEEAAILGVYLHGLAGDFAANKYGMWSMTARDLISCLGEAFGKISK
jgi:ADP-dependent NAD(P)H-hydrate dehydratase / NAD(P)H-hydrate epimerase